MHPDFCLTRDYLTFFRGNLQVNIEDRAHADSVNVLFEASKTDQNREGCTTTRVRMAEGAGVGKTPVGAFEALVELLDAHPLLPGGAPLMTRRTVSGWKVITRTEAVVALRMMAASAGKNPTQFALHSGRIGGATKLAAQGMSELHIQRADRWKSRAFMVYVRDAGEGAQKVSSPPLATSTLNCYASLACFPGSLNCTMGPRGGDHRLYPRYVYEIRYAFHKQRFPSESYIFKEKSEHT